MASIKSLLNPVPLPERDRDRFSLLPSPSSSSSSSSSPNTTTSNPPISRTPVAAPLPRPRKPKMAKDAPIFNRGRVRGECRFAPCEQRDAELARLHREFQIHPTTGIADFPRHIPYNSDKKSFQEKTGRGGFEVFQYTFKIPGQDKPWTVMWDYNIGLVRTTHLFKCLEYSKTTPAKVLNANPGLREICHSITGGALAAQGYWMPYTAARAIAATFCWKIRHALTPLFGLDFPNDCIPPDNRSLFGRMIISPQVIQLATTETSIYRRMERDTCFPDREMLRFEAQPSEYRAGMDGEVVVSSGRAPYHHHHHQYHHHHHPHHPGYTDRMLDSGEERRGGVYGCGYGYRSSPDYSTDISSTTTATTASTATHSPRNTFTPVNTPRSLDGLQQRIPSPETLSTSMRRMSVQQRTVTVTTTTTSTSSTATTTAAAASTTSDTDCDGDSESDTDASTQLYRPICTSSSSSLTYSPTSSSSSTPPTSTSNTGRTKRIPPEPETPPQPQHTDEPPTEIQTQQIQRKRKPSAALFAREVKAAHALLDLHMQEATATAMATATASDDEVLGSSVGWRGGGHACGSGGGCGCGGGSGIGGGGGGGGEGGGARKRRRASA